MAVFKLNTELIQNTHGAGDPCLPFMVQGLGFRVSGFGFRVQGLWFKVHGARFRVYAVGFLVSGFMV